MLAVYGVIPPDFRMSPHKVDSCRGLRTRPEEIKENRGLRGVARRGERLLFPLAGCLSCGCTCRKYWRLLLKLAQGKRPCRIVVGSPYFLAQAFLPYQPGNFFLGARRPAIAAYPLGLMRQGSGEPDATAGATDWDSIALAMMLRGHQPISTGEWPSPGPPCVSGALCASIWMQAGKLAA